ncbi:hypothetical protein PRIPAC_87196, partial [Pristionchus pacificus]|uniref:Uncharacterized protein n=1 Tax=Pristionchus pacificus TaxID=54126 RepID=A0A2A6CZJ0_PRIPA
WGMEKVDIAEGAVYIIEKMVGGTVDIDWVLINNTYKTVQVQLIILMKHSKGVRAKMWKVDVLNAAASFLKSLVRSKRASTGSECPSSTGSEIATSPVSTPTLPSPSSSDSGNSSLIFGLSPAECCCYAHSELISNPLLNPSTAQRSQSKDGSFQEKKREFYRPWE